MYLPGVVLIKQSRTPPEQAQQGAVSSHFRKSIIHHPNEGLLDPLLLVGPPAPTPLSSSPLKKIGGLGVGTHQGGPHCLPCLLLHPGRIKVLEFLGTTLAEKDVCAPCCRGTRAACSFATKEGPTQQT